MESILFIYYNNLPLEFLIHGQYHLMIEFNVKNVFNEFRFDYVAKSLNTLHRKTSKDTALISTETIKFI